jgi:hypothetical protein
MGGGLPVGVVPRRLPAEFLSFLGEMQPQDAHTRLAAHRARHRMPLAGSTLSPTFTPSAVPAENYIRQY